MSDRRLHLHAARPCEIYSPLRTPGAGVGGRKEAPLEDDAGFWGRPWATTHTAVMEGLSHTPHWYA
jgi:hypothetical protein